MNSAGRDVDYYIKRQKNNEASRLSKTKRKEKEIEMEKKKIQLEAVCLKLKKEIHILQQMKLDKAKNNCAAQFRQGQQTS